MYSVLTGLYDSNCSDSTGANYYGSGVSNCWGISVTGTQTINGQTWVNLNAYLFGPKGGADAATLGYRYVYDGSVIKTRVIVLYGGNKETSITLKYSA